MDEHDPDPEHKTILADEDCVYGVRAYRWVHHYKYFLCRKVYKVLRDKFGLNRDEDTDDRKEALVLKMVNNDGVMAELLQGFRQATLELDKSRPFRFYRVFDEDICAVY